MGQVLDEAAPVKRGDLAIIEADGQWLLHYPGLSDAICVNASAQAILDLCDGRRTVAQIAAQLADECGYPLTVLTADVKCALGQLEKHGIVTLSSHEA